MMSPINVEELTINQVLKAYEGGMYSAEQLVTTYLKRIQDLSRDEKGPKLNSVLAINSYATSQAIELDRRFRMEKRLCGPLHGIPLIIKDTISTAGINTTYGSVIAKDFVPDEDAFLVKQLKQAGAIILAKGTMPDWGCDWFSDSTLSGRTRNPYALNRDSGGSSSGTAASVAANLVLAGIGSDSGGSIRIPASFCNVVGFRPTVGLVSSQGCMSGIWGQGTQAPMGRTVEDVARIMDIIASFDENYLQTSIHALWPEGKGFTENLKKWELSSTRLGVITEFLGDDTQQKQESVNKVIRNLFSKLQSAGATLVDVDIPDLASHLKETDHFLTRFRVDCESLIRSQFNTTMSELVKNGNVPKNNPGLPWVSHYGLDNPYIAGQDETSLYAKQVDAKQIFQQTVLAQMKKHKISALVFPTSREPAPIHEDLDVSTRTSFPLNTGFASQLQWPAISLPAGFTDTNNMPIGLEIVMPPLKDAELLSLSFAIEELSAARRSPQF